MPNNQNANQLQIDIKPEVAEGKYSNLAIVTHSPSEFVLDYASLLPGLQKANVVSRIIMTPDHAKQLLFALQDNVRKYEQNFGEIKLQQPQHPKGNTIAPFNMQPGEA